MTYYSNNRTKIRNVLWISIIVALVLLSLFFYDFLYYGDYKYPHYGEYTCYDYYICTDAKMTKENYIMYMRSAFVNMLDDKVLILDSSIDEQTQLALGISPINYVVDQMGRLAVDVESSHSYSLYENDVLIREIILFTGEEWEKSSEIEMFYDLKGNIIVAPANYWREEDFCDISNQENVVYSAVKAHISRDETIERVSNHGNTFSIISKNFLYVCFIFVIGSIAGMSFIKLLDNVGIWLMFPLGTINQIIVALFLSILHIPINLYTYIFVSFLLAIIIGFIIKKVAKFSAVEESGILLSSFQSKSIVINAALFMITAVLFSCCAFPILSYDSVLNIYIGRYAGVTETINPILGIVSSYSLITPLIEIGGALFGIDLNYAFQPVLTMCLLVVISWCCNSILKLKKIGNKLIYTLVVIAVLFNPMFFIQMFWKLNNLAIGLLIGVIVGFHILYNETNKKIFWIVANVLLAIVTISRVESGIFTAVYIFSLYPLYKNREKELIKLSFGMALLLSIIFFYYIMVIGGVDSDFWTPLKGILVVSTGWFTWGGVLIISKCKQKMLWLKHNIDRIMLGGIVVILLTLLAMEPLKFITNLLVFGCNMANYGGYGLLLLVLIVYSIRFWRSDSVLRFLAIYILSYVFSILIVLMFREYPIRLGFGDSACRMLTHIVFVGGYLCLLCLNYWNRNISIGKKQDEN
ncbi:MAG: hypothetical protein IJ336_04930 [Lachnospiraceae bacterium]|nr:hypothetical protein [Lachnospiraceae bacterium]